MMSNSTCTCPTQSSRLSNAMPSNINASSLAIKTQSQDSSSRPKQTLHQRTPSLPARHTTSSDRLAPHSSETPGQGTSPNRPNARKNSDIEVQFTLTCSGFGILRSSAVRIRLHLCPLDRSIFVSFQRCEDGWQGIEGRIPLAEIERGCARRSPGRWNRMCKR